MCTVQCKRRMARSQLLYCSIFILVSITNAEFFTIHRGHTEDGSNKLEDVFTLPSASQWCGRNFTKCSEFYASKHPNTPCSCVCPLNKSTLQLHNDKWACDKNENIRTEGCTYSFFRADDGRPNAPLPVVGRAFFKYLFPLSKTTKWRCHMVSRKTVYQSCRGEWKSLPTAVSTLFKLFVPRGTKYYVFKVNETEWSQYPELDGKIFRLFITCRARSSAISQGCLLFKLKGSFNCTAIYRSAVTTVSTSSIALTENFTTAMVTPTTLDKGNNSNTVKNVEKSSSSLSAIVAGAVSAVVLFLLLLTTVVLFIVRRSKVSERDTELDNNHPDDEMESEYCDPTRTCATTQPVLTNKTRSSDGDHSQQIDANSNASPTYQSLVKDQAIGGSGDYQSLVNKGSLQISEEDDGYIYSTPYCVTRLTSSKSPNGGQKDLKPESSNGHCSTENCANAPEGQTDNGYEVPINSEMPDYVIII